MNQKFLNAFLLGTLVFSTATMVGCKDYDDDIDDLSERVTAVENSIKSLQADFGNLAYVKSVSFANGVLTVTTNSGTSQTYTIPNTDTNTTYSLSGKKENGKVIITLTGSDGKTTTYEFTDDDTVTAAFDPSKLTIEDGVIKYDGKATGVTVTDKDTVFDPSKLTIEDGVVKYDGQPTGVTITDNDTVFDPSKLTFDNGKILYDGNETGVVIDIPETPTLTITELRASDGSIYGYNINYDGQDTKLVITNALLRALVFIPDFYYKGIEAMGAETFVYTALTDLETANVNGDNSADAPKEAKTSTSLVPGLVANYHVNPSNVNPELVEKVSNLQLIGGNKGYTRADDQPVISAAKLTNGVLTVTAQINKADIKDIDADEQVTVYALQVKTTGELGDTIVTSDYAAVKASTVEELVLADRKATDDVHLYTTAKDAIDNDAQIEIAWNQEAIDLADYVETHAKVDGKSAETTLDDKDADRASFAAKGFAYKYELLGYVSGDNKTSESAHAGLSGSKLRAQMPVDGDAVSFEKGVQSKASIGRAPLVRVQLIDNVNNQVVAVGYVKVLIKAETQDKPAVHKSIYTSNFTEAYTLSCSTDDIVKTLKWHELEENIIAKLGISKADFEAQYELDGGKDNANQYAYDEKEEEWAEVSKKIGQVSLTQTDAEDSQTEVLKWTIGANEASELFLAKNKSLSAIVRFSKKSSTAGEYYYVTINWTPSAINITPSGKIAEDASTLIKENWFASGSQTAGSGWAEIHQNVAVPTTEAGGGECTYSNDVLNAFYGKKLTISGIDTKTYPDFAEDQLTVTWSFVVPTKAQVLGNDGVTYKLSVTKDGLTLQATAVKDAAGNTLKGQKANDVATLSETTVTVAENEVAKALLNEYDHSDIANTLTARIGITAVNECDKAITLTKGSGNAEFDVKLLRPISILSTGKSVNLVDGQAGGSSIEFADLIKFTDWREIAFTSKNGLFNYYGVSAIAIDADQITTDMSNGTLGKTILKDIQPDVKIEYSLDGAISLTNLGKLTYQNLGQVIGDFNIRVPVTVTYKWGTVKLSIDVPVKKTIAQ